MEPERGTFSEFGLEIVNDVLVARLNENLQQLFMSGGTLACRTYRL